MTFPFVQYVGALGDALTRAEATDLQGAPLSMGAAIDRAVAAAGAAHAAGNTLLVVGNGGSAGIASHVAIDFSKNGGTRALAFNDGAALTCLGNDFGYEHVFARQIDFHGRAGDLLIAISSSGRSPNILNAVAAGRRKGCGVVTLSGFGADNPLRRMGDVNLYVPSGLYGFVEIAHLTLLHAMVDALAGCWPAERHADTPEKETAR